MVYYTCAVGCGTRLEHLAIKDVLPYSLYTIPIVTISHKSKMWTACTMLRFFLESFTDQLVVMDNKKPCGLVGGVDILRSILENPTHDFLQQTVIEQIMQPEVLFITPNNKVSDLIQKWKQSRRAFSLIQNDSYFFAISIRTLLGVYPLMDTNLTIRDIPKKKTIHFTKDQSVKEILNLMFENQTRRLILKDTHNYLSDRLVIQTICDDLNYLRNIDNFLEMDCSIFKLEKARTMPKQTPIPKLCELLYTMDHPYVACGDQVFSPFDIIQLLEQNDIYAEKLQIRV